MRPPFALVLVTACATTPPGPEPEAPIDAIWGQTIRAGDLIVAVPGTGAEGNLGARIDAAIDPADPTAPPLVDPRVDSALNPIVLEQAIAATERAGFSDDEIASGVVSYALWGAGVQHATAFDYHALGGATVHFVVLGGTNTCATGSIESNILNYSADDALRDATDLYARTQTWTEQNPGFSRHVIVTAHSWGGAVAEYFAENLPAIAETNGPLDSGARVSFVIAAGVPKLILGYTFEGPGLRPVGDASLYEIDRPDDPVHALDFAWSLSGHQYDISYGDAFQGSYGITTDELSCDGTPGACPTD